MFVTTSKSGSPSHVHFLITNNISRTICRLRSINICASFSPSYLSPPNRKPKKLFLRRRIILHITKILPKQKLYSFLNFQYHTLFNNPHISVSVASASLVSQVGASTLLLLPIAGNFKMRRRSFLQWANIYIKFHEYLSGVSKLEMKRPGHTTTIT
jgi:hypothetical protein